jgi:hypothetical protein
MGIMSTSYQISPNPSFTLKGTRRKEGNIFVINYFRKNIRRKIKRVKVEELRQKSTKGRKWEILAPRGL